MRQYLPNSWTIEEEVHSNDNCEVGRRERNEMQGRITRRLIKKSIVEENIVKLLKEVC